MEKMELSEALKANASVLEGLLGVSSSTIFKGKGYIQRSAYRSHRIGTCFGI